MTPNTWAVETDFPIAFDSPDHTMVISLNGEWVQEGGTRLDCSVNHEFNKKLYELMKPPFKATDWGCAGGCFVETLLLDGNEAVGLEGSDYSLKRKREAWGRWPANFFTCDISRPFQIKQDGQPCKFQLITAWEVLEHLPKERIHHLWDNIYKHLEDGGYFIGSIATEHTAENHQIKEHRPWWEESWSSNRLKDNQGIVNHFDNQFIRGPMQNAPGSFIVALTKKG